MDNLFPAEKISDDPPTVVTDIGRFEVSSIPQNTEKNLILLIRADAGILSETSEDETNLIAGELTDISFRGRHQVATIRVTGIDGDYRLRLWVDSRVTLPAEGQLVKVKLSTTDLLVLTR